MVTSDGATITAGGAVPQVDLARLFDRPRGGAVADAAAQRDGIGGDSIAGGAGKPRVAQAKAVSLSDGSRIIFASAMILEELEPI